MLQNARVTAFFVSKLLRENQQWGKGKIAPPPRLTTILYTQGLTTILIASCRFIRFGEV